jgi:hypothetical protein
MTIIIELSQRKKVKMSYLVVSYRMKKELRSVPKASEPKMAKTHRELARNICDLGNHRLANLVDPLIMKQNPKEHSSVPRQKK